MAVMASTMTGVRRAKQTSCLPRIWRISGRPVAKFQGFWGAAMLGVAADGLYESVEDCADDLVRVKGYEETDEELVRRYEERYAKFRKIYPSVKQLFKQLQK